MLGILFYLGDEVVCLVSRVLVIKTDALWLITRKWSP